MASISQSSRRSGSSWGSARGGRPSTLDGRYDRKRRVRAERLLLGGHHVVDGAVDAVDVAPAELLLGDVLTEACHHRWSGHEDLRGVADHERVVRCRHPGRAQAGHRAEGQRHGRHHGQVVDDHLPARVGRHIGATLGVEALDAAAAAGAVDQADDRQAQLVGHLLGVDLLLGDGGVGRAAPDGEVVAADHHRAAVDAAPTHDEVGRPRGRSGRRPRRWPDRRWCRPRGTSPGRAGRRSARAR